MNYKIYKLQFYTGVHFGNGMLNDSSYTFSADVLFSALYIEALKMGIADDFYKYIDNGQLVFSDAFPYLKDNYFIPKPIMPLLINSEKENVRAKDIKKIAYIPSQFMDQYLKGILDPEKADLNELGYFTQQTMAAVRKEDDTVPFHVGVYHFKEGNGLYIIAGYENENAVYLMDELMEVLSYVGVGGKRSSGLGKFLLINGKMDPYIQKLLANTSGIGMLISSAMAKDDELEDSLEGSTYLMKKRSGFVASMSYNDNEMKKKEMYLFSSGSCFKKRFEGGIFDVSEGGRHPVYRYAKAMYVGV